MQDKYNKNEQNCPIYNETEISNEVSQIDNSFILKFQCGTITKAPIGSIDNYTLKKGFAIDVGVKKINYENNFENGIRTSTNLILSF